jgi:hypothetical protein
MTRTTPRPPEAQRRDLATHDALVTRRRHLVLGWQIHPQLHHFEHAAAAREVATMKLFVDKAGGGGHPLDVARTNFPTAPESLVFHCALVNNGYRLEAAMRVSPTPRRSSVGVNSIGPA